MVWSPDYAPVDGDFDNVSLLLKGEGTNGSTTILDSSSNNLSVTAVGNAQISTAVNTPFGTGDGVLAFDGSGDALVTNTVSSLQMEGFNFTWECWLYLVALPSPGNFMSFWAQRTGNPQFGGPIIAIINTGAIQFYISNANASAFILNGVSTGLSVTLNQWNHYALVRNGSSLTLYKNGTAGSVVTLSTDVGFSDNTTIGAGAADYIQSINGYLSNIRITKGVARYTENFDVPTAPFPIYSPTTRAQA
jgi:hypothetical protein